MKRYVWGAVLIALGVLGFLQVSGQYNFGLSIWPVLLTLAGGAIAWGSCRNSWGPSWFGLGLGLWIGCIGLFGILEAAGVTTITGSTVARFGWPLLLVGIGISVVTGRWFSSSWCSCHEDSDSHDHHYHHGHGAHWCEYADRHGVGDRYHGRDRWVLDGDIDLSHGIGDFVLDLASAEITEGMHRIRVNAMIGEMLVRVPDNVNVTVDAAVSVGQLEVFDEQRSGIGGLSMQKKIEAPDAQAELRIEARLRIGDLAVTRVPGYPRVTA